MLTEKKEKQKQNLVIHSKKLPTSVENDRRNFEVSTEGKALRGEAAAFQKTFQGTLDDAMRQQKRETGSTGMKPDEMTDLLGDTNERHSARTIFGEAGKRKPATAKTYKQKRVLVDGEWQNEMVQVSGPKE